MLADNQRTRQTTPVIIWYSISLMVHLIALGLWLGGIVFFLVVLGPAVHELDPKLAIQTLNQGRIGLEKISWIGIGLLLATGMFNLLVRAQAAPITLDAWGVLLSAKLLIVAAMVVHHCLQVFKHAPVISGLIQQLPQRLTAWPEPLLSYWRRWFLLLKINAALGPIAVLLGVALINN